MGGSALCVCAEDDLVVPSASISAPQISNHLPLMGIAASCTMVVLAIAVAIHRRKQVAEAVGNNEDQDTWSATPRWRRRLSRPRPRRRATTWCRRRRGGRKKKKSATYSYVCEERM